MQIVEGAHLKRQKFQETLLPLIQQINPQYFFREDEYAYSFSYWILEKIDRREPRGSIQELFSPSSGLPRTVCSISLVNQDSLSRKPYWVVSVGDTEEMKVIGQILEDKTGIAVTVVTS